jgi:transcriptional regulator with PAS, ATPase and Fis domain
MIANNEFRKHLFYRLNIGVVKLPPLRDRKEDIPVLIEQLLARSNENIAKHAGISRKNICDDAIKLAVNCTWKGNVRELANTLDRTVLWSERTEITAKDLLNQIQILPFNTSDTTVQLNPLIPFDLPEYVEKKRKNIIFKALSLFDGNKTKAANYLKIKNRQTLSNWLDE